MPTWRRPAHGSPRMTTRIGATGQSRLPGTKPIAVNEKRRHVSEIGYLLARPHWGKGIAAEALTLVLDQLFLVENYRRVFADTDPDNVYSRRLLERLGFQLEGVLRAEWETHIGIRDTTLYGLLKEDWTCRPRRT